MTKHTVWLVAIICLTIVGCQRNNVRPNPTPMVLPPGVTPVPFPGAAPVIPGGAPVVPAPGQAPVIPPGDANLQQPPAPNWSPQQSNLGPDVQPPGNGGEGAKKPIHLSPPVPLQPATPPPVSESKKPNPDSSTEPPLADSPGKNGAEKPSVNPALPSGIPQFAIALESGVTAGLRPTLDGGLDWLQKKGYKTVLHIKQPGEPDAADRKQVEKRGMAYLKLEVSPETLSGKVVDEFARIVSDKNNYPLFVYDKDGSLAGGLWYLYFRDREEEEVARVRANTLGMRIQADGPHRELWLAIQKYLSEKQP
jgi:protein tyrosine phosphatase (PTP) superfamily phosphohydrolase (DUF442 family)